VERCHPALRPDAGAAFAVEVDGEERVVVVWECEAKRVGSLETEAILAAVRSTVAEQFELPMQAVVLLKRGSIFKTSSGKIQRRACRQGFLAGQLAELARWEMGQDEGLAVDGVEGNPLLVSVMEIWQQVLEVPTVRETDNFFELGGDSLKAAMLISEVERRFWMNLPLSAIAQAPTPIELVQLLQVQHFTQPSSSLVPLRSTGQKIPFFYVHGVGGSGLGATQLIPYFHSERPVYGLAAVGLSGKAEPHTTMEAMVQHYIHEIQTVQPQGPYLLGGLCFGGNVAFAMACQLQQQGETVRLVTMADSLNPVQTEERRQQMRDYWISKGRQSKQERFKKRGFSQNLIDRILNVVEANRQILMHHAPHVYSGRVVYFSAAENQGLGLTQCDPMQPGGWNDWVEGGVEIIKVPGRHGTYHNPPHVEVYARKLNACLEAIESQPF
jgi:thioesterase domain-containing protein/acyl carrier protein